MKTTASLSASGVGIAVSIIANVAALAGHPLPDDMQTQLTTLIGLGISFATLAYGMWSHLHVKKELVAKNVQLEDTIAISQAATIKGK